MTAFKKAERKKAKLKIAITGPSGSGKTFSALTLAQGIGKKIALVDTENASASLYADRFDFDTVNMTPPYIVPKYVDAILSAEKLGYDVLIIDSITHAWQGEGGLLQKKESMDARGGNSFVNWGAISKEHELFKATLLNCNIHVICTMRSKQDYIMEVNEKGKQAPKKVGLAPIQRDGMEYEFTTVFDVGMDHSSQISKDRTGLFDGQIFKISPTTGETLMQWLHEAKEAVEAESPVSSTPSSTASGVFCKQCQAETTLHKSGLGYVCPNSSQKGDDHLRFRLSELMKYKDAQAAHQTA